VRSPTPGGWPTTCRPAVDATWAECTVLASPTLPVTAPLLGNGLDDPLSTPRTDCWTVLANLTGIAALSLPVGECPDTGLPVGVQLMAPHGADARLLREEIFGPVAPVKAFSSEQEAVAAANATEFGLVSYLYTSDLQRAWRVTELLETGMVGLNQGMVSNAGAPFGGVKQSGIGREGGHEGLEEFLETKYVAVNL